MKIEDNNMPIQRIIKITSILLLSGIIFLCYGWINWESGEAFRFLGALQIFVSINFWIYRLFLRRMANNFQLKILPSLDAAYEKVLNKILIGKRPYLIILGTITLLILSFIGFGNSINSQRTSIEFFPEEDPRQIMIYVEYPEGTDISKTNEIAINIEKDIYSIVESDLYNDKSGYNFMVESTVTQVGEGSENPETELGTASEMSNRAKITLTLRDFKYRKGVSSRILRKQIQDKLKNKYPGVSIAVEKNQSGPPVGYPINIELTGLDYSLLIKRAEQITDFINKRNIAGIEELKIDVNKSRAINLIKIDRVKAGELGISAGQIGQQLRTSLFGSKAGIFKSNGEDYDINIRFDDKDRYSEDVLFNQNLIFKDPSNGQTK
jgi:multidrug efflux pump subunit AcrB